MAISYTCLAAGMFLWCVINSRLLWGRRGGLPETSAFPLIDFSNATSWDEHEAQTWLLDGAEVKGSKECRVDLQSIRLRDWSISLD